MRSNIFDLRKILDLDKWQLLQDSLAQVTKMAIVTVDYRGTPLLKHSAPCAFCQHIRSNPETSPLCEKCDSRGGLEAVRFRGPYIYLCHCNIVDMAIPIVLDDMYCGAIMAGQIRISDDEEDPQLEHILPQTEKDILVDKELLESYDNIPKLPFAEICNIARLLSILCDFIVHEAVDGEYVMNFPKDANIVPKPHLEANDLFTMDFHPKWDNQKSDPDSSTGGMILRPVLDCLKSNPGSNISLQEAAGLCNLSVSYFSRLFKMIKNENYSTYCLRKKVEYAKRLLETTDLTISQISENAGFCDSSHFIRNFKNVENLTPGAYKKRYGATALHEQP